MVKRFAAPHEGGPKAWRDGLLTDASVQANVEGVIDNIVTGQSVPLLKTLEFAMRLVPVVGGLDDFVQGKYLEGALSLLGDAAMIGGLGLALAARNCTYTGARLIKFGNIAAASIEGGIAATRLGQGFHALGGGQTADAWGYFGDATLRLLGLSAQAVALLRKPKCFVAGTPIHAEGGAKPIEQVEVGDRVWAYDRQAQQWRLCPVTQTYKRVADRLTTLGLEGGEELTGTDDHPFWVVEGDGLHARPGTRHGADEPAGPTPGRWVAMADLRPGDVVLTRQGRAGRVASAATRDEAAPVYNLEVAGLHSYAVGGAGVLVHNNDCGLTEGVVNVTREAPVKPPKPQVKIDDPGAAPLTSTAGGATANGATAPVKKTVQPTTLPRGSRTFKRPTKNQMAYTAQPKKQGSERFLRQDEDALKPYFDKREAAQLAGDHAAKTAAGREVGEKGAERYMQTRKPNTVQKHVGRDANNDLDFVYLDEVNKTYYVVEAKGLKSARRTRDLNHTGVGPSRYAQQGSLPYLDDTLQVMFDSSDSARVEIARKLRAARRGDDGFKLVYMEVATQNPKTGKKFLVTYWTNE